MSNVTNKPLQVDTMTTKPTVLQVSFRTTVLLFLLQVSTMTTSPTTGVHYDYYTYYRCLLGLQLFLLKVSTMTTIPSTGTFCTMTIITTTGVYYDWESVPLCTTTWV